MCLSQTNFRGSFSKGVAVLSFTSHQKGRIGCFENGRAAFLAKLTDVGQASPTRVACGKPQKTIFRDYTKNGLIPETKHDLVTKQEVPGQGLVTVVKNLEDKL